MAFIRDTGNAGCLNHFITYCCRYGHFISARPGLGNSFRRESDLRISISTISLRNIERNLFISLTIVALNG